MLRYEDKLLYSWIYRGELEGGKVQGKVFKCLNIITGFVILEGNLSVRKLTCLAGFEADNKRLSGESINISWFIIWVLILASDRHCISPAHIQTNTV